MQKRVFLMLNSTNFVNFPVNYGWSDYDVLIAYASLFQGRLTRSNFWRRLLLKFKDVSDANSHFCELKPVPEKRLDTKTGW